MFKYYIKVIIRNLLKVFWIFPIDKKKIYFQSFDGKSMNCNPWYIFKYMYEKYPNYKYVWLLNHELEERLKGVTYVKKNTLKWVKEILTSKVVVTNTGFPVYLGYKEEQILIDTWHGGGAYKKVGKLTEELNDKYFEYLATKVNYYISSCQKFSEVMSFSLGISKNKFLPIGMPRNDVFFHKSMYECANNKVRQIIGFGENDYIVLYAPTYRGDMFAPHFESELNIQYLKEIIQKQQNKNIRFLFRGHYFLQSKKWLTFDKDVSDYPDMQELLCATDMLITDYSSSMWDYSFLYRPCFLFTPDIEMYIKNRGLYTNPYSWGFPICKTNEELAYAIKSFDHDEFVEAMKKHHYDLGSYEKGNATEQIVKLII